MSTLLEYFQMEAAERLERLRSGLIALERSPRDQTLLSDLFREAHSLKGAAGISGLTDVSEVCHKMEDLLSNIRDGTREAGAQMVDAMLGATDAVQQLIAARAEERDCDIVPAQVIERLGNVEKQLGDLERSAEAIAAGVTEETMADMLGGEGDPGGTTSAVEREQAPDCLPAADSAPPADVPLVGEGQASAAPEQSGRPDDPSPARVAGSATDTVRLRVSMLESLANLTGELMVAGDRMCQQLGAIKELYKMVRKERSRRHNDQGVGQALRPIEIAARSLSDDVATDFAVIEPLIADIHERVLDTRMLPLGVLFDQLPRFVRDYCRQEDKKVELHIEGASTRVDREVLEQLRDPMIHLIRNALTHGIESPGERERQGKNPVGTLRLATSRLRDLIQITCEDDGRGIDLQRVLAKAISAGLVTEAEAATLSPGQIQKLILRPGFSTAETVTDVCGRGVGMDVVASRVEALHGTLGIESEPASFTRFVIEFPASMATLDGLLVETAGHTYVVPTAAVVCTARVKLSEMQTTGGATLLQMDGNAVPLVMLADLLGHMGCSKAVSGFLPVVVVRRDGHQVAIGVDRLLGTQTVVGKGLGDHISGLPGVVGATVLGTGVPALIVDPGQLVKQGATASVCQEWMSAATEGEEEAVARLLVVDDSITTRMMERSILESAGYTVDTAVSAEDALAKIKDATYRLFVVDVEMPGLNGFELTRKLRENEHFAETPIVIVTSLAKEEHRQKGLEAGANAYIVKGEFDQNNLLDTVERLVGQ